MKKVTKLAFVTALALSSVTAIAAPAAADVRPGSATFVAPAYSINGFNPSDSIAAGAAALNGNARVGKTMSKKSKLQGVMFASMPELLSFVAGYFGYSSFQNMVNAINAGKFMVSPA